MAVEGNKIVITFSSTDSGLVSKDGIDLKHFAITDETKNMFGPMPRIRNNAFPSTWIVINIKAVSKP